MSCLAISNGLPFDSVLMGGQEEAGKVCCGSVICVCIEVGQRYTPEVEMVLLEVERGGYVVGASLEVLSWT